MAKPWWRDPRLHCTLMLSVLGLAAARPALAVDLGSVFYTPEQRRLLERRLAGEQPGTGATSAQADAPSNAAVRFSGIVRRSAGPTTAWIGDRELGPGSLPAHVEARLIGDALELTGTGTRHILRAGEQQIVATAPLLGEALESGQKSGSP
ncbi:MAG: hypothetical protein R3E87_13285 [Burkholderiaceae bacterium]